MAIQFQCHGCRNPFSVPAELGGTKARCNKCGAIVTVPMPAGGLGAVERPLPQLDDPLLAALQSPAANPLGSGYVVPTSQRGGISKTWLWVSVGGAALVLLLLVGGVGITLLVRSIKLPPLAVPLAPESQAGTTSPAELNVPGFTTSPAVASKVAENASAGSDYQSVETTPIASTSGATNAATPASRPAVHPSFAAGGQPLIGTRATMGRGSHSATGESILPRGSIDVTKSSSTPAAETLSWSARPDPLAQPLQFKKGKISVPFDNHSTNILLPNSPSHFVMVRGGSFRNKIWQVLDLRTAKQIGKPVQGEFDIWENELVFSPDGRYAAAPISGGQESIIGVWSFATGQMLREIQLGGRSGSLQLCFGGPHQLAIAHQPDFNRTAVSVWDLQSGAKLHEMSFSTDASERIAKDSLVASPGAKYLALITGDKLGVIELATGQAVGQVQLPAGFSECNGLAFSPDGADLALDVKCSWRNHVLFVDFNTGQVVVDREIDDTHFWYDGPRIEWMPDKSGILYKGHMLIDRVTGEGVWIFPRTDSSPRRMLRTGEMLVVLSGGRGGKGLQTVDIPLKEITKGLETVRSGGEAIDAVLPALTTPDLFSASVVTLPNGYTEWSAIPDAAGSVPRGLDRELLVAKEGETLKWLIFAAAETGKVAIQKEVQPVVGVGGGRRGQRRMVVERHDVASGSKGPSIEIPSVYQLVATSPSGNYAVIGYSDEKLKADRIDVVSLAQKKHIAGWRPYAGDAQEKAANAAPWDGNSTNAVRWLAMVDDEHVITVSSGGKLVNWHLPDCKAAYYFEQFGEPLAMSPGRKYLAGVHNGQFRLFDTASGTCVGDLESPATGVRAIRAAFRHDGAELAAVIDGGEDKMLVRWNLSTGKIDQEFPIPGDMFDVWKRRVANFFNQRNSLEYRGNGFLLVDNTYLVDLGKRALLWRYELQGSFVSGSPDDKTWFCIRRDRAHNSPVYLTTYETPSPSVLRKSAEVRLENQLVLYPGMSVRLIVDLSGVNMQNMEPTVRQALQQSLENRGIIIDDAATLTMSVLTSERSTGEVIGVSSGAGSGFGYSPFFQPRQPDQTLSKQQLVCRLAITDASGRVRWFRDRSVTMRSFGSVQQGNAEGQLRKEMEAGFTSMLANTASGSSGVPTYFFASLGEILGGESQLVFGGEAPIVRSGEAEKPSSIAPGAAP